MRKPNEFYDKCKTMAFSPSHLLTFSPSHLYQLSVLNELTGRPSQYRSPLTQSLKA